MALTSFDATFDYTFGGVSIPVDTFPVVGGDGGGSVGGSVLPFAQNTSLLPSCFRESGTQGWERWSGVPISLPDYLMPFILAVPLPTNLTSSPYCTGSVEIVDADSATIVLTPHGLTLHRVSLNGTLYVIFSGDDLRGPQNQATSLPDGHYRLILGDSVSDVFAVKCAACNLLRIRLLNDSPLGDLLYGKYSFQQTFYVEGELSGPSWAETDTTSGSTKTGATTRKTWTLNLDSVSEPIADALSLVGSHRLVEVAKLDGSGAVVRAIQAMAYSAKSDISVSGTDFDVKLTLPVQDVTWGTAASAQGCDLVSVGDTGFTELVCA